MRLTVSALESREVPAAAVETLPVVPDLTGEVLANVRTIAQHGRAAGLRSDVFVKLGDSITEDPQFLGGLGTATLPAVGTAGLTADDLATVLRYSAPADASGANSFDRRSYGAFKDLYLPGLITRADAEADATKASVALILIGTNDTGLTPIDQYAQYLEALVDDLTGRGVVPVLTTLPHLTYRQPHSDNTARAFSQVVADVAERKHVPLINLRRALDPLPFNGLKTDMVHLNASPNGGGQFGTVDLLYGQNIRGLVTLQTLTRVRTAAIDYDPAATGWAAPVHWTPLAAGQAVFAVGSDAGNPGEVAVYDTSNRAELGRVRPFERSFLGGVKVATADVTGDGVSDLVVGAGEGGGPLVAVYDGRTGQEVRRFFAYEPSLRGGVNVAAGDTDGDGRAEIVVGAGVGGAPRVRVFRDDGSTSLDFFAFESGLRTGVTVAAVGDGVAAGAGVGGGPVVAVFDGRTGAERGRTFAYAPDFRGGITLAGGVLDGQPTLVTAPGPGGGPHVRLFDPHTLADRSSFLVGADADPQDGTRVAVSGGRVVVATGSNRALAVRRPDGSDAGMQGLPDRFPAGATFVG